MEGYKTLYTDSAGIHLLNRGIRFGAWDQGIQGDDPVTTEGPSHLQTYRIFVPATDIQFIECGSWDVIIIDNVIVDMEECGEELEE